jgi:hypothetical protein
VNVAEDAWTGDAHQSRVLRSTGNKKRTSLRIFWLSRPGLGMHSLNLQPAVSHTSLFRLGRYRDAARGEIDRVTIRYAKEKDRSGAQSQLQSM